MADKPTRRAKGRMPGAEWRGPPLETNTIDILLVHYMDIKTRIGELAEWSKAAVLKTVEGYTSGGSNPSLSAKYHP